MDKKIVLTGGGTTGHVSVNLALIPLLKEEGWDIYYIGSKEGIERELVEGLDLTYIPISTGKLRRYFSWNNLKDVFKVIKGIFQSINRIRKIKPNITFSKGGFVSVPVVIGSWFNRVPVICHESDLTPGLANKISQPFSKMIMVTFKETSKFIKNDKAFYLGPVIRDSLKNGDINKGKEFFKITNDKPNILIMGGSLGAKKLNEIILDNLDELLEKYNIIHGVGKGNLSEETKEGYYQREYIGKELKDVLALSDVIVSRAGSNAIFEFLYYKKPMLLIPLPSTASRGDQIENAENFRKKGFAEVIQQDDLNEENLLTTIDLLYIDREKYMANMKNFEFNDSVRIIYENIEKTMKK